MVNRPRSARASWRHMVAAVGAPTAAVSLLLLGVSLVPSSASGTASTPAPAVKRVAGRLLVAHGDNFAGHMMNMSAQVSTGTTVVPLQIQPDQHDDVMDLAGQNVVAEGTAAGNGLVLQSVAPAGGAGRAGLDPAHRGRAVADEGNDDRRVPGRDRAEHVLRHG